MTKNSTITLGSPIKEAIRLLEKLKKTIVVVIDEDETVLGTISDGDIRRGLLNSLDVSDPIDSLYNRKPITCTENQLLTVPQLLEENRVEAIPVLNSSGKLHSISTKESINQNPELHNIAGVIMAGGEGKRLLPLTKEKPKPLVEIANTPIIFRLIKSMYYNGIRTIFITVNYMADMIVKYVDSLSLNNLNIHYIYEEKKLGTAGSLYFLQDYNFEHYLSVNADIVTNDIYYKLIDHHLKSKHLFSVCCIKHRLQVPYGVITEKNGVMTALVEKPFKEYLCNAGMYIFHNSILSYCKENVYLDMTDIIDSMLRDKLDINIFPLYEYWSDIGCHSDLIRVREEIKE